ncbi:hypothetical protein RO967_12120 [Lactiplantibacillus plantarum]|nr:hypothetical protein [Lactiplantibacillus plantarum]
MDMQKAEITKEIRDYGIMSVVRADVQTSLNIAEAGLKGGVKLIELSFTVPTAQESIKQVKKKFSGDHYRGRDCFRHGHC